MRESSRTNGSPPGSGSAPSRNPPLVIVSERGRHSEASRRIVRAQAARASAAQSRETRARNREDRSIKEGGPQSPPQGKLPPNSALPPPPPPPPSSPPSSSSSSSRPNLAQPVHVPTKPLVSWITNVLHLSTGSFVTGAAVLAATGQPRLNHHDMGSSSGGGGGGGGGGDELFSRRLPLALPRGFVALQQRLQISDAFLAVISRTACFDFASPGVQDRLNQLLFDIVMASAAAGMTTTTTTGTDSLPPPPPPSSSPYHPIQAHVRIACTCLTIFQAQRAAGSGDGAPLGLHLDARYNSGLDAAWAEALLLDHAAVREPKATEAALWALFVISVTGGAAAPDFQPLLRALLADLQLTYWEQVRGVFLEFIYPGSCLDEPCRRFFDRLLQPVGLAA